MPFDRPTPKREHPAHRVLVAARRPTIFFVTVCTKSRLRLLDNDATHGLVSDVWSSATAWLIGRYVLMPDHVHLFAALGEPQLPLTNWISFWKRAFTRRYSEAIWQDDYWDTTLRDADHATEKWAYIEQNPVRASLVKQASDWPYQGELNELPWR